MVRNTEAYITIEQDRYGYFAVFHNPDQSEASDTFQVYGDAAKDALEWATALGVPFLPETHK